MLKIQKLLSVALGITMVASMGTSAFGSNICESINISSEINGNSGYDIENVLNSNIHQKTSEKATLSNISLSIMGGKLNLEADLINKGEVSKIVTNGAIYNTSQSSNIQNLENVVLVDMEDTSSFGFVQFKIDKSDSTVDIILQDLISNEIFKFTTTVSNEDFDTINVSRSNTLSAEDLDEKLIGLYSVTNNLVVQSDETSINEYEFQNSTDDAIMPMNAHNEWVVLLDNLVARGEVYLNNYNIDRSIFKGIGWNHEHVASQPQYAVSSYSVPNGSSEYLTQITFLDVIVRNGQGNSNNQRTLGLQLEYLDGMIVEYNKYTDKLSVLYYNFGLSLTNTELAVNGLSNNAVFINRNVSGSYSSSGRTLRAAIALSSTLNTLASAFEYASSYELQSTDVQRIFDGTYQEQFNRYQGNVIRGILVNSNSQILNRKGHYQNVTGDIVYNAGSSVSFLTGYKYSCTKNI